MTNKYKIFISILFFSFIINSTNSQTINVDVSKILKTFDHNPAAINMNYLMDDDNYLDPKTDIKSSLSNMKVGALRFPGGEKADNYLWSVPPYKTANPQFATKGNCNFPNNDTRFSSNFINPLKTTLDFDEFMLLSHSLKTQPLIVVSGDAHYNTFCEKTPTLQDLITNAVEWVRYANIKKKFNIKYWMIGNESWNKAAYDQPSTALQYAYDFVEFAKAMKSVDPTITVVANTKSGEWVKTLLENADGYIDAVAISNYPIWDWKDGYDTYRNGNPNFVEEINSIITSIGDQEIGIIVSEYNSIDWNYTWPLNNDLGHALVDFQMFGDQIKIDKVIDAYLWNTRWIDNNTNPQGLFDAIDSKGNLNANGLALSLWGGNMLQKIVQSNNVQFVNSFATLDSTGLKLNLFLINKDYSAQDVEINISNFEYLQNDGLEINQTEFTGKSAEDKFPTIKNVKTTTTIKDSTLKIKLNPLSITVLKLKGTLSTDVKDYSKYLESIQIYPNPTYNILTIENENYQTLQELKIYSYLGELLHSETINSHKTEIDMGKFSTGVYIVSIGGIRSLINKY